MGIKMGPTPHWFKIKLTVEDDLDFLDRMTEGIGLPNSSVAIANLNPVKPSRLQRFQANNRAARDALKSFIRELDLLALAVSAAAFLECWSLDRAKEEGVLISAQTKKFRTRVMNTILYTTWGMGALIVQPALAVVKGTIQLVKGVRWFLFGDE